MPPLRAENVAAYLKQLPPDRREAVSAVLEVMRKNMPKGYAETMAFGMPCFVVPLEVSGPTYNGEPLMFAAIASQKNHVSLYLMDVYASEEKSVWFRKEFEARGKKLDMGKSCVRFRKLEDMPLDLIGEAVRTPVAEFVERYQALHKKKPGEA